MFESHTKLTKNHPSICSPTACEDRMTTHLESSRTDTRKRRGTEQRGRPVAFSKSLRPYFRGVACHRKIIVGYIIYDKINNNMINLSICYSLQSRSRWGILHSASAILLDEV